MKEKKRKKKRREEKKRKEKEKEKEKKKKRKRKEKKRKEKKRKEKKRKEKKKKRKKKNKKRQKRRKKRREEVPSIAILCFSKYRFRDTSFEMQASKQASQYELRSAGFNTGFKTLRNTGSGALWPNMSSHLARI